MKVIANETLLHEGQHVAPGEVIDLPEDAVKALGDAVKVQPTKAKDQKGASSESESAQTAAPAAGEPATVNDPGAKAAPGGTENTKESKQ